MKYLCQKKAIFIKIVLQAFFHPWFINLDFGKIGRLAFMLKVIAILIEIGV